VLDLESGISAEEREEILSQLREIEQQGPGIGGDERAAYRARKTGVLLPVLVNVAAVLVMAAAAVLVPLYFKVNESSREARAAATLAGESTLVGTLQAESAKEIQLASDQVAAAVKERDTLKAGLDAQLAARQQELRAAMDADLAAEKARLLAAGATAASASAQVKALEDKKLAEMNSTLAALQAQQKAQVDSRDAAIVALQAESRARKDLQDQLAALRDKARTEQLVLDQITGSYRAVAAAFGAGRTQEAIGSLDALAAYLESPGIASLQMVKDRQSVDTFLIASLKAAANPSAAAAVSTAQAEDAARAAGKAEAEIEAKKAAADAAAAADRAARPLFDKAEAAAKRGAHSDAFTAYSSLIVSYPTSFYVKRSLAGMDIALAALLKAKSDETAAATRQAEQAAATAARQAEQAAASAKQLEQAAALARQADQAAAAAAQKQEAERTAARDKLRAMSDSLTAAAKKSAAASGAAQEELIALLQVKVQVRQVLLSDSVKAQYPDLSAKLDRFLDLTSTVRQGEGRAAAMKDAAAIVDSLRGVQPAPDLSSVWERYADQAQKTALQKLIDSLRGLWE
jgi:hypothetical protein